MRSEYTLAGSGGSSREGPALCLYHMPVVPHPHQTQPACTSWWFQRGAMRGLVLIFTCTPCTPHLALPPPPMSCYCPRRSAKASWHLPPLALPCCPQPTLPLPAVPTSISTSGRCIQGVLSATAAPAGYGTRLKGAPSRAGGQGRVPYSTESKQDWLGVVLWLACSKHGLVWGWSCAAQSRETRRARAKHSMHC